MGMHSAGANATGMGGLVLGITVLPGSESRSPAPLTVEARKLALLVREKPTSEGSPVADVFQLQEGSQAPSLDKATVAGPPIVLTQGEPVEIKISNQLPESTSVHWHGIELESYYDGVPGWSGLGTEVTPPIEPRKTFVAKFTPPRAGTFIYHTHWHNYLQLTGGLYGPLIVLKPGERFDPDVDRAIVLSLGGPSDVKSPIFVNGSAQLEPFHLKVGVKYRLRLINITPNLSLQVSLLAGATPLRWRPVAKDGMDLPPGQAIEKDARQFISVGECYDFEFQPTTAGDFLFEVQRVFNGTLAVTEVQVR
jgi:FtsP/CotA-like multicopper oxidase with cupredoxin domain